MAYQFRNLVFEGGGVLGIAYVGAMRVLEKKGILKDITRVGGTSAGAIFATILALGYTSEEQQKILHELELKEFKDDSPFVRRDLKRLREEFGWYKGDNFHEWIGKRVEEKLGTPHATFEDLKKQNKLDLYVYGTNLSTRFAEVFSAEHTPKAQIADAVRISMSIPLFFAAFRNDRGDVYVDGGMLNNYPVKLFDREKYIHPANKEKMARPTDYYDRVNDHMKTFDPSSSPYVYNKETLGFRLDSEREIEVFRDRKQPEHEKIQDFFDFSKAMLSTVINGQGNVHLHDDDWHRSIYIDTRQISGFNFELTPDQKRLLEDEGQKGAEVYFDWFDDLNGKIVPKNRVFTDF